MKQFLSIIFLTCSALAFADETVFDEEVWLDGDSFYKSINNKKKSTLYFEKWAGHVDQFLQDDSYFVALQLDETFDPLPIDDVQLPSLLMLATVGDQDIRKEYYTFLESFGRTRGINYMILPDTSGLDNYKKEVLVEMNANSPFYFLSSEVISFNVPTSKKDYESKTSDRPIIWIAGQNTNTKKIRRWSDKLNKNQNGFYRNLKRAKTTGYSKTNTLSESLKKSLYGGSIVAIDPNQRFPISREKVCYLGSDVALKHRLSQYTEVVSYRMEGLAVIVDNRDMKRSIQPDDIVLQNHNDPVLSTALVLPEVKIEHEDIILAKALFGVREVNGRSNHPFARKIPNYKFLGYTTPQWENMNLQTLNWIDSLATDAIQKFATPGMQVAVVKNGSIVLEKNYGYYTYDSIKKVSNETKYDIASLTKVIATLPAVALLIDQGKINLDDSISTYLKSFSGSNKSHVTVKQLLSHNAGVLSYVPFWSMVLTGDRLDAFYYKTPEDEALDIRTYGLEPDPSMLDSLKSYIVKSRLIKNPNKYHYSDIGFMILHLLVEEVSGRPFDEFVHSNFFEPMGLSSTVFNPKEKGIGFEEIAPTEFDHRYRNYQVWGEVHDRNALVFGGVAGHAGLFSSATDLAKMMTLFMNKGVYGGRRYLSEEVLSLFNERYFVHNRRGLGWDKKDGYKDSASMYASDQSFGHTGFTGTMVWADPENELIFIFLSNRIYPDADNWKLGELETRTHMHDVIYQSLE